MSLERAIADMREHSCTLSTEEARLATAMRRIYRATGDDFQAVVSAVNTELRTLAEHIRQDGGDLKGWSA